ncbi:MAG: M23 family metallopeptidase [Chloroflexi bacterium]|nr:MAG: M23 family metallopeptidase [Chloroflexota bacterium]
MAGTVLSLERMLAVRAFALVVALCALATPALAAQTERDGSEVPPPPPRLIGYRLPIAEPLVLEPALLPGASRAYRAGIHEGIDFRAPYGMPVQAARDGVVVRVDSTYAEWSADDRAAALAEALRIGHTPDDVLDRIRGRQVWIDHRDGVVTRYAHLSKVADLAVGERVVAGEIIGAVGASGLPEGGPHLHFEIRVGTGYLGEGLSVDEVSYVLARAFSPDVSLAVRGF